MLFCKDVVKHHIKHVHHFLPLLWGKVLCTTLDHSNISIVVDLTIQEVPAESYRVPFLLLK